MTDQPPPRAPLAGVRAAAAPPSAEPMDPRLAGRLAEFARACKAAARAVSLYPAAHPAIKASMARLSESAGRATEDGPLAVTVLPDGLLVDNRAAARPDPALGELALLLHDHLVGSLTIHPTADQDAWRTFLLLVARPPEEIRAEGGIGRLWTATGSRSIELVEIDYAEVLRERAGSGGATWDEIVALCLNPDSIVELTDDTIQALVEIAGDPERLAALASLVTERAAGGGAPSQVAALMRMISSVVEAVSRREPERLDEVLRNVAASTTRLSPEALLEFLNRRQTAAPGGSGGGAIDLVGEVVTRMEDANISHFVARSVMAERGASDRLAEAFQSLVPENERRHRLIEMARDEAAESQLGQEPDFPNLWEKAADMLKSYSDERYVHREYARELSTARTQAVEVERVSDDPPEQIAAWMSTVSDAALRGLDLQLLLDLLAVVRDDRQWQDVTQPVVSHIDDLLLIGDFDAVLRLVEVLVREAGEEGAPGRKPAAANAIKRLVAGPMMRHVVAHLRTLDDQGYGQVKKLCHAVGPVLVSPLAEALAGEQHARGRQRLTDLLVGFGAAGRKSVEQLRNSPNAAVRRTAIYLLREFGGDEALPDLALLLEDAELNVRREAIRAILNIGTDDAYAVLEKALASGSEASRVAIMEMIVAMRDERAAPLFSYIVSKVDHRGALTEVYRRAIDGLGMLRDETSVDVLKDALYRGEWWAPRRTAMLRLAAATALGRIGTPRATETLAQAAQRGSRGIRKAVKQALGASH